MSEESASLLSGLDQRDQGFMQCIVDFADQYARESNGGVGPDQKKRALEFFKESGPTTLFLAAAAADSNDVGKRDRAFKDVMGVIANEPAVRKNEYLVMAHEDASGVRLQDNVLDVGRSGIVNPSRDENESDPAKQRESRIDAFCGLVRALACIHMGKGEDFSKKAGPGGELTAVDVAEGIFRTMAVENRMR